MSFVNIILKERCIATGSDNYDDKVYDNELQHHKHYTRHIIIQTRISQFLSPIYDIDTPILHFSYARRK